MKDHILKSYVDNFSDSFGLNSLSSSTIFEHFVNYCITSKQYPRELDIDSLSVGGNDDIGIDGAAFIVNGNIVQAPEEIKQLLKFNGYLDVSFLFIQTKKGSRFKGDQVGNLIFGLKTFFDDKPSIPENDNIANLRAIKDAIYKEVIYIEKSPILNVAFATTGEWKEPKPIMGRVSRELKELEDKKLFSQIFFNFFDAEKLKQAYREINRKTVKEVPFSHNVVLPKIEGVRQAFVGSLSITDYIKLIADSEGKLQKNLFEDNIRDFQGNNKVNKGIKKTILHTTDQAALSVLNNGITIIAKKIELIGTTLKLNDFQIVNGCQTSHVLFINKDKLLPSTHIVVKIIETTDYDFAVKVIKATNKQTEVKDEAFESLSEFHKDLEEFYKAKSKTIPNPLFYERRSKQYDGHPSVKASQVISLSTQIKTYVSAQLEQPQSTHRYFGEILDSNRSRMFQEGDSLELYYISALVLNRIEDSFKKKLLDTRYKIFRYHILYLVYQFYLAKVRLDNNCDYDSVIKELGESLNYISVFKGACKIIDGCRNSINRSPRDLVRSKAVTDRIKDELENQFAQVRQNFGNRVS